MEIKSMRRMERYVVEYKERSGKNGFTFFAGEEDAWRMVYTLWDYGITCMCPRRVI
jgi:hypothetical protein